MLSLLHNWIANFYKEIWIRMRLNKMDTWIQDITILKRNISLSPIRFIQGFSVMFNVFCILFGSTLAPFVMLYIIIFTQFWLIGLLYLVWIVIDRNTGFTGGRKLYFLRNLKFFEYYRDYFPVRLIKTSELPPDKNYLLVMYPHGIIGYSVLANFATNANNFDNLYPGLDTRQITLDSNFYTPFSREYLLSLGGAGASESSISYLLNSPPAKAVVLVAGGAQESLLAHPGTYKIVLNNRKGFIRLALKSGASLVPVFSFGENDSHYQYTSEWWSKFQKVVHKVTRVVPIIPAAKCILPYRRPINTVVGSPIQVPKVECASQELIDKYHEKYKSELIKLFETYKGKYDVTNGEKAELIIY